MFIKKYNFFAFYLFNFLKFQAIIIFLFLTLQIPFNIFFDFKQLYKSKGFLARGFRFTPLRIFLSSLYNWVILKTIVVILKLAQDTYFHYAIVQVKYHHLIRYVLELINSSKKSVVFQENTYQVNKYFLCKFLFDSI